MDFGVVCLNAPNYLRYLNFSRGIEYMKRLVFGALFMFCLTANAQSWRNCIPNSIAPGGCDSIAPGGGKSIAPGGGMSIAPGGGLSIAPGGGQSIAPGGGQAFDRDKTKGLNTNTMRPYGQ